MAKELPYFRFTVSEWLNDDISLEDYETKGVFSDVCAFYWFKDCSITKAMLEKRFRNALPTIQSLIELSIIKIDSKENVIIKFLDEQYDLLSEKRLKRSLAGKKGGLKKSSNAKAKLKQSPSYKDNNKDNNKDKDNKNIPLYEEFKTHALTKNPNVDLTILKAKYESWLENGWKDGNNRQIKNWKSKLTNTVPYMDTRKNNYDTNRKNNSEEQLLSDLRKQAEKVVGKSYYD